MENMFITATREKFRFETIKGFVNLEDLWEMKLTNRDGYDLNNVAKTIAKQLKDSAEEDFVTQTTKANKLLEAKLEIVKYIIKVKIDEKEALKSAIEKKEQRERLDGLIQQKQNEVLAGKSIEELQQIRDSL